MIPTVYLAFARDVVIVAALATVLYLVYRSGEDRVRSKDLQGLQNQMKRQGDVLAGWRKESTDANAKLSSDVAAIHATPAVQHAWVCPQAPPGQPAVLPRPSGQAGGGYPAGGGVQRGPGGNAEGTRRDQIVDAYKKRWETKFAEWRAEDSQWPQ